MNNTLRLVLATLVVGLAAALPLAGPDLGLSQGVIGGAIAFLGAAATALGVTTDNAKTRELAAQLEQQKKEGS